MVDTANIFSLTDEEKIFLTEIDTNFHFQTRPIMEKTFESKNQFHAIQFDKFDIRSIDQQLLYKGISTMACFIENF